MTDKNIIDPEMLGVEIQRMRKQGGYKSASEFSEAIEVATGVPVSRDAIYRIEKGTQDVTLRQFAAISKTLFGQAFHKDAITAAIASLEAEFKADELERIEQAELKSMAEARKMRHVIDGATKTGRNADTLSHDFDSLVNDLNSSLEHALKRYNTLKIIEDETIREIEKLKHLEQRAVEIHAMKERIEASRTIEARLSNEAEHLSAEALRIKERIDSLTNA